VIPFTYQGFYDFPLCIVFELDGLAYLLDRPFNEALDEYESEYGFYRLSMGTSMAGLPSHWTRLTEGAERLGALAVRRLPLDDSRRRYINMSFEELLRAAAHAKRVESIDS